MQFIIYFSYLICSASGVSGSTIEAVEEGKHSYFSYLVTSGVLLLLPLLH